MENKEIYYHYLREDVRKYLEQEGALKGLIKLLALLYSAAEDISSEEKLKEGEKL